MGVFFVIHIFFLLMDLKMTIKQLRLLSVNLLSSQNVYLTRRPFLLPNLRCIVSVLRYRKSTANNNKFVVLGDSKPAGLVVQVGSSHYSNYYYEILVFLHTVRNTVIFVGCLVNGTFWKRTC